MFPVRRKRTPSDQQRRTPGTTERAAVEFTADRSQAPAQPVPGSRSAASAPGAQANAAGQRAQGKKRRDQNPRCGAAQDAARPKEPRRLSGAAQEAAEAKERRLRISSPQDKKLLRTEAAEDKRGPARAPRRSPERELMRREAPAGPRPQPQWAASCANPSGLRRTPG